MDDFFENPALFAMVWEGSAKALALTDTSGRIIKANKRFCKFFGSRADGWQDAMLPFQKWGLDPVLGMASGQTAELEALSPAGARLSLRIKKQDFEQEARPMWLFRILDVTQHEEQKRQIELGNANVMAIFENVQKVMLLMDSQRRIKIFNTTAREYFIRVFDECPEAGQDLLPYIAPHHAADFLSHFAQCLAGEVITTTRELATPEGIRFFDFTYTPIASPGGDNDVILMSVETTTERAAQRELLHAKERAEESDRLKSAFLRIISHEVRTPMNSILGFADLLERRGPRHPRTGDFIDNIARSTKQLLNVLEDVLVVSKIEAGLLMPKASRFPLKDLIQELAQETRSLRRDAPETLLEETFDPACEDLRINTDRQLLRQILSVLLDNAFKFTPSGTVRLGCALEGGQLVFSVEDTGLGIAKEKQETIFKSFSQADESIHQYFGGMGLGLSIALGALKALGGQLELDSEPGRGTRFAFRFELSRLLADGQGQQSATPSPEPPTTPSEGEKKPMKRLLIVEDEPLNFLYINELVADLPIEVTHATNGASAVELACAQEFDLVLMDLKMPILSGEEAAKRIRKSRPNLPMVAHTAFAEYRDDYRELGFNAFLAKPFTLLGLRPLLDKYLWP